MLRRQLLRRMLITVAATTFLGACTAMQKNRQMTDLDRSLKAYTGSLRWGNYDTAAAFAVPRKGPPTVHPGELSDIQITGYSVVINGVNAAVNEASVHLNFTYYDESRGTVGSIDQDATWYLVSEDVGWLMDDSLPKFSH
jgi:hypothetical protein